MSRRNSDRAASIAAVPAALASIILLLVLLTGCGSSSQPGFGSVVREPACPAPARSLPASTPASPAALGPVLALPEPVGALLAGPGGYLFAAGDARLFLLRETPGPVGVRLVSQIRLPPNLSDEPHRLALTPDGRLLLISAGSGALVAQVSALEQGHGQIWLGRLQSAVQGVPDQAGAASVRVTLDGRFVFVARSRARGVAVFDLRAALVSKFLDGGYRGRVPVGLGPMSLALAPGGQRLFATALTPPPPVGLTSPPSYSPSGVLAVIDVPRAEVNPDRAVLRFAPAGCSPVAVAAAPDGTNVWVAAPGEHAVLDLSGPALLRGAGRRRVSATALRGQPSSVSILDGGARLAVADSTTASGGITLIDTNTARGARPAVGARFPISGGVAALVPLAAGGELLASAHRAELRRITLPALTGAPSGPKIAPSHVRALQMALHKAQKGRRRRPPGPALHQAGPGHNRLRP